MRTADITVSLNFPPGTPDVAEKMVSSLVGIDNHSLQCPSLGYAG